MIVQSIPKPWGCELLLAHTERYAGKILFIRAGHRLSLQHHACKDETLYLLSGEAALEVEIGGLMLSLRMTRDRSYRIPPGHGHRLSAISHARVIEVSTPELEDVVRWEDDYGRATLAGGTSHEE
jgi:mannose-6-phosphate isomerase-like protein (cupin superfamily)